MPESDENNVQFSQPLRVTYLKIYVIINCFYFVIRLSSLVEHSIVEETPWVMGLCFCWCNINWDNNFPEENVRISAGSSLTGNRNNYSEVGIEGLMN